MKLEQQIILAMRTAIANLDTDLSVVSKNMNAAHELFGDHLLEWSEEFATLYNRMLEIYRAHRPLPKGHYRHTHIGIGYSSFPVSRWIADKEQPVPPTAIELVARFDALIQAWNARSGEITEDLTGAASSLNPGGHPMAYSYKKTSIIAYRVGDVGAYPLYVHPECVDQDFPGQGEAVFAQDIVLGDDGCLYFPGEYHQEWGDRSIHTTCCGGCGQWFEEGGSLDIDGLEAAAKQWLRSAR